MDVGFLETRRQQAEQKYNQLEAEKVRIGDEMSRLQGEYRLLNELIEKINEETIHGSEPRGSEKPSSEPKTAPRRTSTQSAK
jgi:cell division protein FtsB